MSRCDYDVIFYRVFCLSLLVIAFIFTVILTNVFVDIDGLLSKKEKAKSNHVTVPHEEPTITLLREPKPEILFNEEKNYEDTDDGYRKEDVYVNEEETYRNKRSLEDRNFIFHLQNPSVKRILTNHLNTLLEQMDAEEFKADDTDDPRINNDKKEDGVLNGAVIKDNKEFHNINKTNTSNNHELKNKDTMIKATVEINDVDNKSKIEEKSRNKMLHLAMHDILLQGIIGHMDLSEVYTKFNMLKSNFEKFFNKNEEAPKNVDTNLAKQDNSKNIEGKFFEELIKCKDLQHQILDVKDGKNRITLKAIEDKKPEVVVKTLIDISSINENPQLVSRLNGKEVKGVIRLIYNGNPVRVRLSSSEETDSSKEATEETPKATIEPAKMLNVSANEKSKDDDNTPVKLNIPQSYLNKAIANYIKKYSKSKRSINDKRYKRHIHKIHYDPINKTKSEDDELYVEIETHFDSKGLKGEKRKKMIRTLIEKIEKAIHSNSAQTNKTRKHFHAHVKKRIQNPLIFDNADALIVKKVSPVGKGKVEHRHLDPIGKMDPIGKAVDGNKNDVPNIYDKSGENWRRPYSGPGFLAPSKALNSAELSEVDVDYNRVMTFNGIPQRLQKPLNTENSDEALATNYYDLGNLKFFVKDMDGSGISVGFNQYTDEEPDPETIKIFTGVDNLVKVYNHNYGQPGPGPLDDPNVQTPNTMDFENNGDIHTDHTILRRSAVVEDYHSNEYKMVVDSNYLPYDSYQEIFERRDKKEKHSVNPLQITENVTEQPITMDIFNKKLKPSEIFSLANLLEEYRKKRSITVQKYSNIKTRRKLNKYLQTKPSKLFINKKRMKRHIDKIRIIATDKGHHPHKQSDENIFVVSNEDELSNRAIISEALRPSEDTISHRIIDNDKVAENVEEVYNYNQNQPTYFNQMFDDSVPAENYITHVFDGRSRHNPLMSKYPHVFMEEISRSKERDTEPAIYGNVRNVMANIHNGYNVDEYDMPVPIFDITTPNYGYISNNSTPQVGIREPNTKTKYKLTVKIVPKNMTEMKSGFKEVHTSINKSYDKDGLRFYSLVNVSEISKIENIDTINNKSKKREHFKTTTPVTTVNPLLKAQQFKIKSMLKRHKEIIDLQLAHFKKEKEHLERYLATNQSESDEVLDIKLPGEARPLQMKKSDISKLLSSILRSEQQSQPQKQPSEWPSTAFSQTQPISTSTYTTTTKATTTYATTIATPIATPAQNKGPDKRLINIIEKNGKLTKEILNKIDKNTEMLKTFLVKLIDRIERPPAPPTPVQLQDHIDTNKPRDIKMFPTQEEFLGKYAKNDSNFAIPFIYAYQHPYVNTDQPNTAVANVVYHGHIHTDSSQITKEVMNANSRRVIPKVPQKPAQIKPENKGKFFIDSDVSNGYKSMSSIGKTALFPNQGMGIPANVTTVYADKL